MDELFETLCLVQTRTIEPLPLVLVGDDFWSKAVSFQHLADEGLINPLDTELFGIVETAEDAWDHICRWHEKAGSTVIPG